MGLSSVMGVLICCVMVTAADVDSPIPVGWDSMCTARIDPDILGFYVDNVTKGTHVIRMQCDVRESDGHTWRFQVLRDRLREIRNISLFLQVSCSNGGMISLPWPMKAQGLVGLVVSNCILSDKYADFGNQDITQIADQLRVLEMRNSIWLSDGSIFDLMTSSEGLANLTSDYDCGQDNTIEYLVTSNISYTIVSPEDGSSPSTSEIKNNEKQNLDSSGGPYNPAENLDFGMPASEAPSLPDLMDSDLLNNKVTFDRNASETAENEFMNLLHRLESLDLKCNFEKLKLIDESFSQLLPIHHFKLMVKGARYPELRIMNYSWSGIRELPQELQDFRVHFPKLEYLDLSRNYLTAISLPLRSMETGGEFLALNVRNNLITNISVEDIVAWANVEDVIVDIRDNPIHCGCHMEQLLLEIESDTFFVGKLQKYDYIRELECGSPSHLKGQKLSKLDLQCALDSQVADSGVSMGIIIGSSVTVIVIVVAVLFAMVVINHHHGQEILKKKQTENDVAKPAPGKDVEAGYANTKTKV